jgi:hypothetical protein
MKLNNHARVLLSMMKGKERMRKKKKKKKKKKGKKRRKKEGQKSKVVPKRSSPCRLWANQPETS